MYQTSLSHMTSLGINAVPVELRKIPIDLLHQGIWQQRTRFDEEALLELADSLKAAGKNVVPIIVKPRAEGGYSIIAGERRWRAAQRVPLHELEALVGNYSHEQAMFIAAVENLQRKDLSIFEEAFAISALIKEWGLTQDESSKRLGMSQSALANKLRLLKLLPSEQRMIEENKLTERHARAILRLESTEDRAKVLDAVVKNGLNVKKTEELIDRIVEPPKKRITKGVVPKDIRLFINTIDHAVSTMLTAGINAKAERKETDEYIECIVRIPKNSISRKRVV